MTWEYRVLHEEREVPGVGMESTYSIIEAYYAKPGRVGVYSDVTDSARVTCSRCGWLSSGTTLPVAHELRNAHKCPDVVESWSMPGDTHPHGETVEELVSDIVRMLRACWKPVLERKDLPDGEAKPPPVPLWYVRSDYRDVMHFGAWSVVKAETMGQAVDAYIAAYTTMLPPRTRFEVKPHDG